MGYNVQINTSSVVLPRDKLDQIYEIWCSINAPQYNKLKRGGSWAGGKETAKWYSWMDENYHETCEDVQDILEMLGFDYTVRATGDIQVTDYNNKTGQEELFFVAIAHLIPDGRIVWVGEDADIFEWNFVNGVMVGVENPFIIEVSEPLLISDNVISITTNQDAIKELVDGLMALNDDRQEFDRFKPQYSYNNIIHAVKEVMKDSNYTKYDVVFYELIHKLTGEPYSNIINDCGV